MGATPDPRLNALLERLEPRVRREFLDAIRKARRAVDLNALTEALARRDLERAVEILRIDDAVLRPLGEAIRAAYIAGGVAVGEAIPAALEARFGFGTNPRAEAHVNAHVGTMIEGIRLDSMAMTREVIAAGVNEGIPSAKLARQITGTGPAREGGFLGLTRAQAASITKARAKLLSGDPAQMREYLDLELRNKRNDAAILRAIREGRAMTVGEVDKILAQHRAKALGYRGRVIAQTEARTALRAGRHEGYLQLEANLPEGMVIEKTWLATRDGRTRDSHGALGGKRVRLRESFISPLTGAMMDYPGDSSHGAPGSETIQCRCDVTYRVRRVKRPQGA